MPRGLASQEIREGDSTRSVPFAPGVSNFAEASVVIDMSSRDVTLMARRLDALAIFAPPRKHVLDVRVAFLHQRSISLLSPDQIGYCHSSFLMPDLTRANLFSKGAPPHSDAGRTARSACPTDCIIPSNTCYFAKTRRSHTYKRRVLSSIPCHTSSVISPPLTPSQSRRRITSLALI